MKLIMVRHGETEWNKQGRFLGHWDIDLNSRGVAQARETAQAVIQWKHKAVYSSPLRRTMQVAEEISLLGGAPVVPTPGLMELGLGDLEGVTGEEMRLRWPEIYAAWRDHPEAVAMPGGESLAGLQERAWNSVLELEQDRSEDEYLILVSHNFAIRAVIGKLLGMPLANFHRMSLNLSSICVIESNQWGRRLLSYNSTSHLSPENQ